VVLRKQAKSPSVLLLDRSASGALRAHLEPIDCEAAWRAGGAYGMLRAAAALAKGPSRVLATGPAARTTTFGAIGSASAGSEVFDTWAGRAGFGTQLLSHFGIAAIVLPAGERAPVGNFVPPETMAAATVKYRYDPRLKTGGTLGGNLASLREKLLCMNHTSIHWSREKRAAAWERLVGGHYLAQFREGMKGRRGRDCGETCPADCKKVDEGGHKKDFQPYQALGPNIGIFDQRAAEKVNDAADAAGFDAVEIGAVIALRMEHSAKAHWDVERFDPIVDSEHNAQLALAILDDVVRGGCGSRGVRAAARELGSGAAVYVCNGDSGGMAPNQYWVPGIVAPVAVGGRYYVDYSFEFAPPRELGRRCAERMVRELALDNLGLCRFQREWAEGRMDLLARAAGVDEDVIEHHRALACTLDRAAQPKPWESARTREMIAAYLDEVAHDSAPDAELEKWRAAFVVDCNAAAGAYWHELREGICEGLTGR
jgi:glyceraldehyde-3-phosphate dehydrogenase (ferredoxin)